MSIHSKLDRWRTAGIIDETTFQKISQFENENSKPHGIFYVTGFGAISIALGIVALVASNWQGIPGSLKIVTLFALCTLVSFFIKKQKFKANPSFWILDSLILVYSGLVISGVGLIGQVFQLHGSLASPLLVWTLSITPLVFFSVGYVVPLHWTLLVLTSVSIWIIEWVNIHGTLAPFYVSLAAIMLLPLVFIGLGKLPKLKERLPNFSKAFIGLGWVFLIVVGSLGQITWQYGRSGLSVAMAAAVPALLMTALGTIGFFLFLELASIRLKIVQNTLILFCTISPFFPLILNFNSALLGALGFMFLWTLVARIAYENQNSSLFKQATSVIGIRLFILYSQTLGGFLGTGIGLILSGILLIVGVKIWYSKSNALTKKWRPKV